MKCQCTFQTLWFGHFLFCHKNLCYALFLLDQECYDAVYDRRNRYTEITIKWDMLIKLILVIFFLHLTIHISWIFKNNFSIILYSFNIIVKKSCFNLFQKWIKHEKWRNKNPANEIFLDLLFPTVYPQKNKLTVMIVMKILLCK